MNNFASPGTGSPAACRPASLDDRLQHLQELCTRLKELELRFGRISDDLRVMPKPDSANKVLPPPGDLLSRFGAALDFAGDRIIALEDLAQRIDSTLFNHENRAQQAERVR